MSSSENKNTQSASPGKVSKKISHLHDKLQLELKSRLSPSMYRSLWLKEGTNHEATVVAPAQASDPDLIKFIKRILLALETTKKIADTINEYHQHTEEYNRHSLSRAVGVRQKATTLYQGAQSLYQRGAALYRAYSIFQGELRENLAALADMANNKNLSQGAKDLYAGITKQVSGFQSTSLELAELPKNSSFSNSDLGSILDSYFAYKSPPRPAVGEDQYDLEEKKEAKLEKLTISTKIAPIAKLAEPAVAVTKILDDMFQALEKAVKQEMTNNPKQGPGKYTSEELKVITDTMKALKNRNIDEKEFWVIEQKGETPISKMVKTVFNLIWCAHEVYRKPDPGILTIMSIGSKAKPFVEGLDEFSLDPNLLPDNLKAVSQAIVKTALSKTKDLLLPRIDGVNQQIHDYESKNGIRFGALLREVRPSFDTVEDFFVKQGVAITNPLGINQEEVKNGFQSLKAQKEEYETLHKNKMTYQLAIRTLKNYRSNKKLSEKEKTDLIWLQESDSKLLVDIKFTESEDSKLNELIKDLENIEKKISQELTEKTIGWEFQQGKDQVRLEYFFRTLKAEGLNPLLRAVSATADNLSQKRKLAVLLADYKREDRQTYINDAHAKSTEFIKIPVKNMMEMCGNIFSGKLGQENKSLGNQLAIEVTLGGYVGFDKWSNKNIICCDSAAVAHANFVAILGRLEASQLSKLIDDGSRIENPDLDARKRLNIFKLLLTEKPYTINDLKNEPPPVNLPEFIKLLVDRYHEHENQNPSEEMRESKNAIGLCLARLAYSNPKTAKIIFETEGAANIIKAECFMNKKNHSLYTEALVNSFSISYINSSPANENRTLEFFVRDNAHIVIAIHKEMNLSASIFQAKDILEQYKKDPIALAGLIDKFTKTRLSAASTAKEKMSEFFSAIVLCKGESKKIRDRMLTSYIKTPGAMKGEFLDLLTSGTKVEFWNKIRLSMANESLDELSNEFKSIVSNLHPLLNTLPPEIKSPMQIKQNELINNKLEVIRESRKVLGNVSADERNNYARLCRAADKKQKLAISEVKAATQNGLEQVINAHKLILSKKIAEQKEVLGKLMGSGKLDESARKNILSTLNQFHPERELDTLSTLSIDTLEKAGTVANQLIKLNAEISKNIEAQVKVWREEIESKKQKFSETKDNKEKLNKLAKLFDIPLKQKMKTSEEYDKEMKALEKVFNLEKYKQLFTSPENEWQDYGALIALLASLQNSVSTASRRISELTTHKIVSSLNQQVSAFTTEMTEKLKVELHKAVKANAPAKIEKLIHSFPALAPDHKPENSLQMMLKLSKQAQANLTLFNQDFSKLLDQVNATDDQRGEIKRALANCISKQAEMAEQVANTLPDIVTATTLFNERQNNLMAQYQKVLLKIVTIQYKSHENDLTEQYNNEMKGYIRQVNGLSAAFTEETSKALEAANPVNKFREAFNRSSNDGISVENVDKVLAELAVSYRSKSDEFTKFVSATLVKIGGKRTIESKTLDSVIKDLLPILDQYLKERSGLSGKAYSVASGVFGYSLRTKKLKLVTVCRDEVKKIQGELAAGQDHQHCAKNLIKCISNLENNHNDIAQSEEQKGKLQQRIASIQDKIQPLKNQFPEENIDRKPVR